MDGFADARLRPAVAGGWPGRPPPGRHRSHRAGRVPIRRSCGGLVRLAGDPGRARLADPAHREHRARLPGDGLRDRPPIRTGGIRGARGLRDPVRAAAQPGGVPAHPASRLGRFGRLGPGSAAAGPALARHPRQPGRHAASACPTWARRPGARTAAAGRAPTILCPTVAGGFPLRWLAADHRALVVHLVRDVSRPGRYHGDQHGGALRLLAWPAHARANRRPAGCRSPPSPPACSAG